MFCKIYRNLLTYLWWDSDVLIHQLKLKLMLVNQEMVVSYFKIVLSVLEQFLVEKHCQKRGGKWDCDRRRETIIGSQVQEIEPKGA